MEEKPNYYAIIPANVRYDKDIIPNAKLLYGEITALCNKKGYCWATNDYFSNLYCVSKTSISTWIKSLADAGYIYIEYDNSNKENLKRCISILKGGIKENLNTGIKENLKDNIKIKNNKFNNKEEDINSILKMQPIELQEPLKDFLKMRKAIKHPMTTRAFKLLLNKLNKLSDNEETQIKILEQSILHSWQDIYTLKEDKVKSKYEDGSDYE